MRKIKDIIRYFAQANNDLDSDITNKELIETEYEYIFPWYEYLGYKMYKFIIYRIGAIFGDTRKITDKGFDSKIYYELPKLMKIGLSIFAVLAVFALVLLIVQILLILVFISV